MRRALVLACVLIFAPPLFAQAWTGTSAGWTQVTPTVATSITCTVPLVCTPSPITGVGVLSFSGALPNGTTATTQAPGDNSTKVATTAFVLANAGTPAGAGTELQYRNAGVLGAVTGSSVSGGTVTVTALNTPTVASGAGNVMAMSTTTQVAANGASKAGKGLTITADPAVASLDTAGAAAGGAVTITTGAAARNASGNAAGGPMLITTGAGIGSGKTGWVQVGPTGSSGAHVGAPGNCAIQLSGTGYTGGDSSGFFTTDTSSIAVARSSNQVTVIGGAMSGYSGIGMSNDGRVVWTSSACTNTAGTEQTTDTGLSRAAAGVVAVGNGTAADASGTVKASTLQGPGTTTALSGATGIATITYAASNAVSAEFLIRIQANDATNFQSLTTRVRVSSVRKATGNTVSAVNVVGTDLLAESAGGSTLTCTPTVTEGAGAVTLNENCTSSLTTTTFTASFVTSLVGPATVAKL